MPGLSDHLTKPNEALAQKIASSHNGMMHWAGTGPEGKTCFNCENFSRVEKPRKPELWKRCLRWARWYRGSNGTYLAPNHKIDPSTPACSHFVERPVPMATSPAPEQIREPGAPLATENAPA